jgi:hypothetical protein
MPLSSTRLMGSLQVRSDLICGSSLSFRCPDLLVDRTVVSLLFSLLAGRTRLDDARQSGQQRRGISAVALPAFVCLTCLRVGSGFDCSSRTSCQSSRVGSPQAAAAS